MVGKRIGYGKETMAPHSLTLTMVGSALLWVGWFGFNAGSALEANGFAALAFINTLGATAAAVLAWCVGEALMRGKASMLGAASGAVAGLVAITPAAGNVGIGGGLIRMPALIYLIGCPTHVAVGTDLFEVMISGLYGAASYTFKGRVELVAAIVMLVGAAMGAQVGSVATKYIKGYGIRIAFGLAVVGCLISVLLKLIPTYFPATYQVTDVMATVLILGLVAAMSVYITVKMVQGAKQEIAAKKGRV